MAEGAYIDTFRKSRRSQFWAICALLCVALLRHNYLESYDIDIFSWTISFSDTIKNEAMLLIKNAQQEKKSHNHVNDCNTIRRCESVIKLLKKKWIELEIGILFSATFNQENCEYRVFTCNVLSIMQTLKLHLLKDINTTFTIIIIW